MPAWKSTRPWWMLTMLVRAAGLRLLSPVHFKRALQWGKEMTVQLHSGVDNHCEKKKNKKSWPSQVTVSFSQGTNWRQQLRRWHDLCSRPSISVSFKSEQTDMCLQLWEIHERCIGSPEGRIIPSQGFYSTVCIFETHKKQPTQVCNRYIWNYDPKIKMSVSHYEEFDAFSP